MDSVQERYEQFRATAQQFPVLQFGLSCFTWDAAAARFDAASFQFPIFPRFARVEARDEVLPDRRFLLQARCLQYVRDHGFDLNAWIDDGVGYLSHADQAECHSALASSAQPHVLRKFDPRVPAIITADTREFLDDVTQQIHRRLVGADQRPIASARGGLKSAARGRRTRRSQPPHVSQRRSGGLETATVTTTSVLECHESDRGEMDLDEPQPPPLSAAELRSARKFLDATLALNGTKPGCADWPTAVFLSEPLAPFRRYVLVQHVEKQFPDVLAFDCRADNSGEDAAQNPWKRRVRLVAVRSAREKQCLLAAYELNTQEEVSPSEALLWGVWLCSP